MNYGNIRLRMTPKTNVGCLPLRSEMNYGKHSVPYDANINVGCLPLRSEINYGNYSAPYDAKNKCRVFAFYVPEMNYGNIRFRMTLI